MRLFIILAAAAVASAAKLDKTYLPPNAQASAGSNFLETPFSGRRQNVGFNDQVNFGSNPYGKPERAQAALERNAAILRQYNQNDGDTFSYAFETENGIFAEENGVATNGVEAQGGYSYTGDDGQVYSIRYTADQNGFVPQGDHLPTAPPVPEEILKALEQNARDEAAGIYDDGSYNEAKYGDNTNQYGNNYNGNNYNGNRFNGNANNGVAAVDSDDTVVTNSALFPESAAGFRSQAGQNGLKAYLPPVRGPAGRNTFARRPSYNARDGYRY